MTSRGTINNKNDFRAGFPPNGTLIPPSSNNQSIYSSISKVKLLTDGTATLTNGNITGLNSLEVADIIVDNVELNHITFPNLTANTALILNSTKELTSSVTTDTELSYVHGVTSSVQNQKLVLPMYWVQLTKLIPFLLETMLLSLFQKILLFLVLQVLNGLLVIPVKEQELLVQHVLILKQMSLKVQWMVLHGLHLLLLILL